MEPVTIQIPETIDEVKSRLGGIERLLTAKGWERAAIVYAFTREPGSGGDRRSVNRDQSRNPERDPRLTAREFASLGISGISHWESVYECRRVWQSAIDSGEAVEPRPGEIVGLPDVEYPRSESRNTAYRGILPNATVDESLATFRKLSERPEVAERIEKELEDRFVQKAGQDPVLHSRINRTYEEMNPIPEPPAQSETDNDWFYLMGIGTRIYTAISREQGNVNRLVGRLKTRRDTDQKQAEIQELLGTLQRCREMVAQIEGLVENGAGVDYDQVYRRLVNG